MRKTWIEDNRTWPSPAREDEGIALLAEVLRQSGGRVGLPSHAQTHLRMSLDDFGRLQKICALTFDNDRGIVAKLRTIKSPREVDKKSRACAIADRAFGRVGEIASSGTALSAVFRDIQKLLLDAGADWVPYLAGGAGADGYPDVISPADDRPLQPGDVLMLDTGAVHDGYFCDFDRNFAIGHATAAQATAHSRLIAATHAGLEAARPGTRACDPWRTMAGIVSDGEDRGRLGHEIGMQLTEGLSVMAEDPTVLCPGMVLTLEPTVELISGGLMVHEENILITDGKPTALSQVRPGNCPLSRRACRRSPRRQCRQVARLIGNKQKKGRALSSAIVQQGGMMVKRCAVTVMSRR
ncbi:MAG: M24 family metallopeptidase [Roseovarius sp.]|nr:M24 family metallopeptidase [Roseovarius sp.]